MTSTECKGIFVQASSSASWSCSFFRIVHTDIVGQRIKSSVLDARVAYSGRFSESLFIRRLMGATGLHVLDRTNMKIRKQDLRYGAVLNQLAEHAKAPIILKYRDKEGLYLIDGDLKLFILYSGDEGPTWRFKVTVDDLDYMHSNGHVALNCGNQTVCGLSCYWLRTVLNMQFLRTQTFTVELRPKSRLFLSGLKGNLGFPLLPDEYPEMLLSQT